MSVDRHHCRKEEGANVIQLQAVKRGLDFEMQTQAKFCTGRPIGRGRNGAKLRRGPFFLMKELRARCFSGSSANMEASGRPARAAFIIRSRMSKPAKVKDLTE
jgi:hypothetical protein